MDSQDSPSVIPCSEEMTVEQNEGEGNENLLPPPDVITPQNSMNKEDLSQSQSLLANTDDITLNQDEEISRIDVSTAASNTKINSANSFQRNSVNNNSTMDLESSEMNPMSSTRIEPDNSISLLNEGFMIDSASLSLSAVNDDSRLDPKKITAETSESINETDELESTEMEEIEPEDEIMEDESIELQSIAKKRKEIVESDEDEENSADYPLPQFPMARVKKIMSICAAAEDDDANEETGHGKARKDKGKGNIMLTKEAIYLTTLATEHFISVIGKMAGNVTTSSKKKTLTLEHLKRALSDTDAFAFLEGCFQPSLIIGD